MYVTMSWVYCFFKINYYMNMYKFSVLISNMVGIAGYYAHKPKLSGVLNTGKNVKGSRDQRVQEPLLQGRAYCVLGFMAGAVILREDKYISGTW